MATPATVVTVTAAATLLTVPTAGLGKYVALKNDGAQRVYIGDKNLTADASATGGFWLDPGDDVGMTLSPGERPYGRCASGQSTTVRILTSGF